MDTILEILETIKPGADFASSTDFIEEHLLESMEILQLVSELNDEFDINITLPYIKPENFKSVESIRELILAQPLPIRWAIYIIPIVLIIIAGAYGPGWGVADFIYAKF